MDPRDSTRAVDFASPPEPSGEGTGALVCGILSLVIGGVPLVGLILGIVGLRMSRVPPGQVRRGTLQAGYICSIIGLILGAISSVFWVVYFLIVVVFLGTVFGSGAKTISDMAEEQERRQQQEIEYAQSNQVVLVEPKVETVWQGGSTARKTYFWATAENKGSRTVRQITVQIDFQAPAGPAGPVPATVIVEVYLPPGTKRALLPEIVLPPAGWAEGFTAKVESVDLVPLPEPAED
ncbi:MAG: DUF4190 domain-containing protein [Planctomycetes bacterium]|nr:DUF4190 domain-containing protein [Planctomycetota bacterium]